MADAGGESLSAGASKLVGWAGLRRLGVVRHCAALPRKTLR